MDECYVCLSSLLTQERFSMAYSSKLDLQTRQYLYSLGMLRWNASLGMPRGFYVFTSGNWWSMACNGRADAR